MGIAFIQGDKLLRRLARKLKKPKKIIKKDFSYRIIGVNYKWANSLYLNQQRTNITIAN
jgi:bifunctional pyridoxal-dependent enzyme with beta-cystathionase and maltose regulon repressor activities